MLKFVMLLLFVSTLAHSQTDDDFKIRVSWVKTMKELMLDLEKKEGHLLVDKEKSFLLRLKLIEEAWADSRYNCFYGGWPSTKSGKFCQNPSKTNSSYDKKACKEGELQCQPLLFGNGRCVPGATQAERNKSFSNCEEKSDKTYEHLKKMSSHEIDELKEMSQVAFEVCEKQKSSICEKVKARVKEGFKAIDRAALQVSTGAPESVATPVPEPKPEIISVKADSEAYDDDHDPDCADPEHEHEKLAKTMDQVSTKTLDDQYEAIKKEFLSSPFCDPLKIVNDPTDKPAAFVMKGLFEDLRAINQLGAKTGPKDEALKNLSEKWKISPEVQAEVLPLMNQLKTRYWEDSERVLIAKIKGIILQDFMKKPATGFNDVAKEELADNNIFTTNDDGEIECPFVSKDAFMKAVNGLEGMKKKFDVRKKGQITIVDYTRPSNERRLFVIDLATNKVLHNTWVAHGFGTKMVDGKLENISAVTMADGFEYDEDDFIDVKKRILKPGAKKLPKFSNENSSNSSSEGFVLATQASHGTQFGDNVLLFGADKNNSRLSSRGVVMHTWGAPFDSYNLGVTEYIDDSDKTRSVDAIDLLKKADFKNGSMRDMEGPLNKLGNALATSPSLGKTYGCLGVTEMNVKQLDRKGRDKSQLQVLREDLPGSVIFNYSGPEQESKYYK